MKSKKFKVSIKYEEGKKYPLDELTIYYAIRKYLRELEKIGMVKNASIEVKEKRK